MKAYLYNVNTGVYEGETFEAADILQNEDGPVSIARQLLNISPSSSKENQV